VRPRGKTKLPSAGGAGQRAANPSTSLATASLATAEAMPAPPRKNLRGQEEIAIYDEVIKDVQNANPAKAILDLDTWSKRFPDSDLQNNRLYLYMQSYSRVKPPQTGQSDGVRRQLMSKDLKTALGDPESILVVLYLMTVNIGNIPNLPGKYGRWATARRANFWISRRNSSRRAGNRPTPAMPTG